MALVPVSKTKIIPPRRRVELLARQRLLDAVFEALDKKLTLISAPAGYGKTSLLIDMAGESDMPCCWLSLDELDREPQRFAAYFIAALSERFENFGGPSRSVLEGMKSFEQGMEALLVTVVNELYEHTSEHFVFVLDDFHVLDGLPSISAFINRFVQLVDDNCHLVISSRKLSDLSDIPTLVAREQVSGLSFSDLAFRVDELQALVAQNTGRHISDEEAARLIALTEGWITGLQFSGANLSNKTSLSGFADGPDLFDYLGQQVLDRQTPELREFVLRTSYLDEFDAALCQAVLSSLYEAPQDWQARIREIAHNNLFALPVGEDGRWLRYHHLFRDFIRQRFKDERPDEIPTILSRLQQAYESMGEWEKAHHICRQINDTHSLTEMIERASTAMLQRAHLTVESWLSDVPPSMLRTRPGLLSIRGAIAYTKGNLQEGLDLLTQAERIQRKDGDASGLILSLVRRASVLRLLGDYNASLRDAEEVISLTEASDDWQLFHADALRLRGLALHRLGRANQAVGNLERALEIFRVVATSNIPFVLMETGMAYRAIGDFPEARKAYEGALSIWRADGNLFWQATLLNNFGVFHQFLGDYEKAGMCFEEGLLCAQRSRARRLEVLISIGLGDLYSELADFESASQNYAVAVEALQEMDDRFLVHSLALARANLAFLQKDAQTSRRFISDVTDSIHSSRSAYELGLLDMAEGKSLLLELKPDLALSVFAKAEERFYAEGRVVETAVARVWLAAAMSQMNDPEGCVGKLQEVNANRGGLMHAGLVAIHQAREWLNGWIRDGKRDRSLRDLLAQVERMEKNIPTVRRQMRRQARFGPKTTPRLVIQAFGRAEASRDGRVLTLSDWQTQSVRDLFFYFLSSPRPLTKEMIGEALWPEVYESSKMKLRFKNDLYRLRRAVGQDLIQFNDNFYSFNRSADYEYDVEAFEAFLARARAATDLAGKIDLYRRAVDLAQGPYLHDIYADWVMPDRERLRQAYLDALVNLAECHLKQGQPNEAVVASQQAMDFDPGVEAAYRVAMQAHGRMGDRAAITRVYQTCQEALKRLFDLPPSKETEELYRRLMK
ncbi:MAG TPA: tetratricopeptide repeat protein [Anaerolineales bacterium]|nr:tetratricopeptide repeat protein [Anaerolineales bacterium]HNN13499.1 tetratricopeptide repeat protein [Anaerolineales bacterium]HNO31028.1 tetratricopeptide repeat protein [Anaerolineales bacterium]